jgi:hypothetical protein
MFRNIRGYSLLSINEFRSRDACRAGVHLSGAIDGINTSVRNFIEAGRR